MGLCGSRELKKIKTKKFQRIPDRFNSLNEVETALREAGLQHCQLIVGVDFTKSNTRTGAKAFRGRSLHDVDGPRNPYQKALTIIARTLENFDDDNLIPCYGFGDTVTKGDSVFSFYAKNEPATGLHSLVQRYHEIARVVDLSGPTSFGPLIRQAMRDVYNSGMRFHLLLIIADGQVSSACFDDTVSAIVDACDYPLAIVVVGVGDGPWDAMKQFDDALPQRLWDNFQFVEFEKLFRNPDLQTEERCEASFALNTLMELPEQYKICQQLVGDASPVNKQSLKENEKKTIVREPPDFVRSIHIFSEENLIPENAAEEYSKLFKPDTNTGDPVQ